MTQRGSPPGPRPHLWKSGTDPVRHQMYYLWHQARAQAHYRGEAWRLTFDQYLELWQPYHDQRGRSGTSYSMSRHRPDQAWSSTNCFMATRAELNRRQAPQRRARRTRAEIEQERSA